MTKSIAKAQEEFRVAIFDEKLKEIAALKSELAELQADNARLRLVESAAKKALPHIINCAHHHRDDYVLEEEVIPELESALNGDVS